MPVCAPTLLLYAREKGINNKTWDGMRGMHVTRLCGSRHMSVYTLALLLYAG
jgi:hypothetical protein